MNLVLVACALHESGAFSGRPQVSPPSRQSTSSHGGVIVDDVSRRSETVTLRAATVGSSNPRSSKKDTPKSHPRTPTLNEQAELEIIRKELIQKYISLGHSEEYATNEVNYFLEDSERSAQYVEMRRLAMARGNDLGIEMFVQFAAAFLVGWGFSWMMDAFHSHMVRSKSFWLAFFFDFLAYWLPSLDSLFRLRILTAAFPGCHEDFPVSMSGWHVLEPIQFVAILVNDTCREFMSSAQDGNSITRKDTNTKSVVPMLQCFDGISEIKCIFQTSMRDIISVLQWILLMQKHES